MAFMPFSGTPQLHAVGTSSVTNHKHSFDNKRNMNLKKRYIHNKHKTYGNHNQNKLTGPRKTPEIAVIIRFIID